MGRSSKLGVGCNWAATIALSVGLSGCAQIPAKPISPYFERLIAVAQPNELSGHDLLEPRLPVREASIVQDLIRDGFEPQLHGDALTRTTGFIICEGVRHFGGEGEDGKPIYSLRVLWGGPFSLPPFTVFSIDVYRDEGCSLTSVTGIRPMQAI